MNSHYSRILFTLVTLLALSLAIFFAASVSADSDDDPQGSGGQETSESGPRCPSCITAPSAPTGVAASSTGQNSIKVSWDSRTGFAKYRLDYKPSSSSIWTVASLNITSSSYTVSSLQCNTSHDFQVKAYGDGDDYTESWGSWSSSESTSTSTCPNASAPGGLTTTGSTPSSVSLSWDSVTDAYRYKLERREGTSGSWQTVSSNISGTTRTASGLDCDTTYYFRVSARGDGSPLSPTFGSASSLASRSTSTCPNASAPGGLTTTGFTPSSVSLSWNSVTDAYRYKLERRDGTSGSWQTVSSFISGTTRTASGLECNTTYYFRVSARGDGSPLSTTFGRTSSLASRSTSTCIDAPAPTGHTTTGSTLNSVSLSWTQVTNAYRYKLERSPDGTTGWVDADSGADNITGTSYTVSGLECNTTYYLRVSARGDGSPYSTTFGNPSSSLSRDTDLCLPPKPTGVTVTTTATTALVSWDAQSGGGVSSYLVDHDEVGSEGASGSGGGPPQGVNTFRLISRLAPGTNYDFKVRAVGDGVTYAALQGPWSDTVREATQSPDPAPAPTGLTTTGSTLDSITLSWDSVTNAYRYKLEHSPNGTTGWVNADSEADNITGTTYTVTGLSCDTTYYFRVSARGDGTPYSTSFGDPSSSLPEDTDLCLTPAPTGFEATADGNSVDLSWDSRDGISKYRIQHRLSTDSSWPAVSTTVTGTNHTVSNLSYNTAYQFRVAAYGDGSTYAAQWGPYSSDSATTVPKTRVNVSEPTGLAVEMTGSSTSNQGCSAEFTWDVPTGAVAYEYEAVLVGNEGASRRSPTEPPHEPENEHVFNGLWCSTEYDFRVKATSNVD